MVKFYWKKEVAKALVFAMAMGTAGVHAWNVKSPVAVLAEGDNQTTSSALKLEISYTNYAVTITPDTDDKYVFLEVLKDESGSKISNTYVYEVGGKDAVTVPLSFLSPKKEQYIRVYGDSLLKENDKSKAITKKIAKQPTKEAIKFVPGADLSKEDALSKSFSIGDKIKNYQFKDLYGSEWTNFVDEDGTVLFDIANAAVAGTTIVVRQKAVEEQGNTAGAPAGVEIKVKIAASPKAPKVAVDYVKGTIKLPKDTEFKGVNDTKWIANSAATAWTLDALKKKLKENGAASRAGTDDAGADATPDTKGFTLLVRTKAGKKASSVPAFVTVGDLATLEVAADESGTSGTVKVKNGEKEDTSKKLTYKFTTKGMELKADGAAFEYYDSNKSAWKAVAAGKSVQVPVAEQAVLNVRLAGVKASKTTAGSFASLDTASLGDGKTMPKCKLVPATITVTVNKEKFTVNDTITPTMKAVDGNKKEITPISGDDKDKVEWSSSAPAVVKVDGTTITAVGAGEATLTATFRGVKGTVKVVVETAPTEAKTE